MSDERWRLEQIAKGGYKDDHDKIRMELIPPELLEAVGDILTFGAKKYADRNWEYGMKWSRPFGALMRHMWAWWRGEDKDPETWYSEFRGQTCKRTSYNGNIRKNYAGIGFRYDEDLDAFIPPKPFRSWVLNEETARWEAPTPMPEDGNDYRWSEFDLDWVELPKEEE